MDNLERLMEEIIKVKLRHRELSLERWFNHELFSWIWWLGVIVTVATLVIWWKLVDRRRILEISVVGFIVGYIAVFLDVLGAELVLWVYIIRILPTSFALLSMDFVLLPIINMLTYQYHSKWKRYIIVSIINAAVLAFILEPFTKNIGQHKLPGWRYAYSFPIYILISIIAKLVTEKLVLISKRNV